MVYGYLTRKADLSGSVAGGLIAFAIYFSVGWQSLVYFLIFFLVGSLFTKWHYVKKVELGLAQENMGRRSAIHAFSNAGVAGVFGLFTFWNIPVYQSELAIACVFAAATSDTMSSEIGNVIGRRYFNILTLSEDLRGKDGVISWEGTLAGVLGSLLIACIHFGLHQNWVQLLSILIIGIICNTVDSILGASLQQKGILNNNTVNLAITSFAGLVGFLVYSFTI